MQFHYKALKPTGESYEATGEFDSKTQLFDSLKNRGETLLLSEEVKERNLFKKLGSINIGGVKEEQKILFARNMAAMIEAGLPMSRALGVIEKQAKKGKFKDIVAKIGEDVAVGQSLSNTLNDYPKTFPPLMVAMVRAGEESGSLVSSLNQVADQMERSYKLKKKVKGAMLYPGIIISAMVLIGILMMIFVVPTLTATF